jgi:hypothetical protein
MWIIKHGPALKTSHLSGCLPIIIADLINHSTMGAIFMVPFYGPFGL